MKKYLCALKYSLIFLALFYIGCSTFFYYPSKTIYNDPSKLPTQPEDISIISSDGEILHGWYFKHVRNKKNSLNSKPLGNILFFHGNAENVSTHFLYLYYLLDHSFDYMIFDYRGYGLSTGSPSPKGTVQDGIAAIKWMIQTDPSTPLIIFAQSLGGAIALKAISEMKEQKIPLPISLIVVDSSFSDYRQVAAEILSKSWITWLFQPLTWLLVNNSQSSVKGLSKISPIPLLIIHGTHDQVVPYRSGLRIFEHSSNPKYFSSIPEGRHIDFLVRSNGKNRSIFAEILKQSILCGNCIEKLIPSIQ